MASTTNLSGDAIDAIRPDLEAFTSLWTALRITYGGTNITKTIARLLNMYQPDDGIQAYERLLQTLFVLLEDFDGNGLRLLVSMVPPPKRSSDEMIREVFFKATGFVRIDAPIFHQNYPFLSSVTNPIVGETKKEVNGGNIKDQSIRGKISETMKNINTSEFPPRSESPQLLSQDHHSFRGFPSTEVHPQNQNVQGYNSGQYFLPECHNEQTANLPLNGYKMNWLQAPYYFQNGNTRQSDSFYRDMLVKTLDNKYLRVPVAHYNPNVHYFNRPYQIVPTDRNIQSNDDHTITSGLLISPSQTTELPSEKHAKQEENKVCDEMSGTRKRSDLSEHNYNLPKKNEIKSKETDKKKYQDTIREEICKMDVVKCENYVPVQSEDCILENLTVGNNLAESIKNFLNRVEKDDSLNTIGNGSEVHGSHVNDIQCRNLDGTKYLESQSQKLMEKNPSEIMNETNDYSYETNDSLYNQSNSISELAAYKRQYYDALLNIQRAKMAVANSLILAPIQSRNDYGPYHPNNLQQHHWILQQPQRLMFGPSYAQRFVQPEYSVMPNTCIRSNGWMPTYHPARVAPETPSLHAVYDPRFVYANHKSPSQINDCIPVETKLEAKKRKLENIVVKLKENEMNSVHN